MSSDTRLLNQPRRTAQELQVVHRRVTRRVVYVAAAGYAGSSVLQSHSSPSFASSDVRPVITRGSSARNVRSFLEPRRTDSGGDQALGKCRSSYGRGAGLAVFAVLGLFEWPGGDDDDKDQEGGEVQVQSGKLPRKSTQARNSRANELLTKRKHLRSLRNLLMEDRTHHPDERIDDASESFRRSLGEWWENLMASQAHKESASERERRQRLAEQHRKALEARGWSAVPDEENDAVGGALNVLASVKTSVTAAIFGIGARPSEAEEVRSNDTAEDAQGSSMPSFPNPQDWFVGAEGAARGAADAAARAAEEAASAAKAAVENATQATEPVQLDWWQSLAPENSENPSEARPTAVPEVVEPSKGSWWQFAVDAVFKLVPGRSNEDTSEPLEPSKQELEDAEEAMLLQLQPRTELTAEPTIIPLELTEPEPRAATEPPTVRAEVDEEVTEVDVEDPKDLPPPIAPGMAEANLIVRVEIDPKEVSVASGGAEAVARLMRRSDHDILNAMAQSGWEVETIDESKGLYMLSLPAVRYELPGGIVSIPAPRFLTTFRDTTGARRSSCDYEDRAQGDLVLQNGEGIFTLELGFPFRTKFSISAAGWTRACIGWKDDKVITSNYVEVGIQVPKVPGLNSLLEYFVKNYGNESTMECAAALAKAASLLPEEELDVTILPSKDTVEVSETESLTETSMQTETLPVEIVEEVAEAKEASFLLESESTAATDDIEELELIDPDYVPPPPEVPGMDQANLVVRVDIDMKYATASVTGAEGVARLMGSADRIVLETMAQSGWEVDCVDESTGMYMLKLPPMSYDIMGATISCPAPCFLTKFRDTRRIRKGPGPYQERAQGDLVLQNGENIFTLELGFPFRTKMNLSAAGWTRATIGWEGDRVVTANYVEVGIQLPKVPGLTSILEYFVKNYGNESTLECATALASGADRLPPPRTEVLMEDPEKNLHIQHHVTPENAESDVLTASRPGRPLAKASRG